MIDLPPSQLEAVKRILAERVPECEVRAFGSRINQTSKKWSDLDLAIIGSAKLDQHVLYDLKEAFEESTLSIRVDVLDWHTLSPEFQAVINAGYEVVQVPAPLKVAEDPAEYGTGKRE
ncbi:MAG: nucleotidyltransferase domain-containing protein [Verrucomicrobiota bacterium]|nr:nucleotidyltransferase domain-containing protein [Verrucomicrobiota bacterium]